MKASLDKETWGRLQLLADHQLFENFARFERTGEADLLTIPGTVPDKADFVSGILL